MGIRAQGATEYIILVGIAMLVALIGIAAINFFSNMSDSQLVQSSIYWVEATPIAIVEHSVSNSTGVASIVLMNNDPSEEVTILRVGLGNATNSTQFMLGSGKKATVSVAGLGTGKAGEIYDLNVTISYRTSRGLVKVQHGSKNLVGKYA
ncbi:TPA: hypothetical protein HA225_05630 [Candidatus Micrarchaeota archaeon]|nr:hypothetical protein [Candidatus Micrarchaeota archaeon]